MNNTAFVRRSNPRNLKSDDAGEIPLALGTKPVWDATRNHYIVVPADWEQTAMGGWRAPR